MKECINALGKKPVVENAEMLMSLKTKRRHSGQVRNFNKE